MVAGEVAKAVAKTGQAAGKAAGQAGQTAGQAAAKTGQATSQAAAKTGQAATQAGQAASQATGQAAGAPTQPASGLRTSSRELFHMVRDSQSTTTVDETGETSLGTTLKDNARDAKNIGKAALQGASDGAIGGGAGALLGAAVGAGKQAAKTFIGNMKTPEGRRRVLMNIIGISAAHLLFLLAPLISVLLLFALLASSLSILGGNQQAAKTSFLEDKIIATEKYVPLTRVEAETGVPWELLAAIYTRNEVMGAPQAYPIQGGVTGDPKGCAPGKPGFEKGLTPSALHLSRCVKQGYASIPVMYGIGQRGGVGGGDHENGRAIDFMTTNTGKYDTQQARSLGVAVTNWVLANRKVFNVNYVIYYDAIWIVQANGSILERPYKHPGGDQGSPTKKHRDHVHVSVYDRPVKTGSLVNRGIGVSPFTVKARRVIPPNGASSGGDASSGIVSTTSTTNTSEGRGVWGFTPKSRTLVSDKMAEDYMLSARIIGMLLKTIAGGDGVDVFRLPCAVESDVSGKLWVSRGDGANKECVKQRRSKVIKVLMRLPLVGLAGDREAAVKTYERAFAWMLGRKVETGCVEYGPVLPTPTPTPSKTKSKPGSKPSPSPSPSETGSGSGSGSGSGLTVGFVLQATGGSRERFAMDKTQVETATAIVNAARKAGATVDEQVMAIMTAIVEARLRNPFGGDRDSVGAFQQRPSTGWCGPTRDPKICMNLDYSTRAFLGMVGPRVGQGYRINPAALRARTLGEKCQKVQGSAFPLRYGYWEKAARLVVAAVAGGSIGGCGVQGSGEAEPGTVVSKTGWTYPLVKFRRVTSPWGPRTIDFGSSFHLGIDIGAFSGEKIVAAHEGKVVARGVGAYVGNFIVVEHGNSVWTVYQHLSRFKEGVNVGARVKAGTVIGYVGGTSGLPRQFAPHLHFGLATRAPVSASSIPPYQRSTMPDPEPFMRAHGVDLRTGKISTN